MSDTSAQIFIAVCSALIVSVVIGSVTFYGTFMVFGARLSRVEADTAANAVDIDTHKSETVAEFSAMREELSAVAQDVSWICGRLGKRPPNPM